MRSGSVNVICITSGDFTLSAIFVSYLKYLPHQAIGFCALSTAHNTPSITPKRRLKPTRRGHLASWIT
jgi:hypothetical protein